MDFLKRHYEKILLAVLLSVFIGLLAFQLVLWQQNEQIRVEKMKEFKDPPPNYTSIKFEDASSPFRALETLPEKPSWNLAHSREGNLNLYTDFMVPYPMALCPYCNRVIPAKYFPAGDGADHCPFPDCGKVLHAAYNSTQANEQDSDEDGIPDKEEIRLGLNPKDRTDAQADSDDDGFSNFEEFVYKTDPKNPLKRPPYHEKLFVRSIVRAKLPFQLKSINFSRGREKENARIQMAIERRNIRANGPRTLTWDRFMKFNDPPFQSLAGPFKVVDVVPQFVKTDTGEENRSYVVVQKVESVTEKRMVKDPATGKEEEKEFRVNKPVGEKIRLDIGKVTYEPRVKAILAIDLVNDTKEFELFEKSTFKIGKLKTGEDQYTVTKIDQKNNTVTVKAADGKTYVIGPQSILQKKVDAVQKTNRPRRNRRPAKKMN